MHKHNMTMFIGRIKPTATPTTRNKAGRSGARFCHFLSDGLPIWDMLEFCIMVGLCVIHSQLATIIKEGDNKGFAKSTARHGLTVQVLLFSHLNAVTIHQ